MTDFPSYSRVTNSMLSSDLMRTVQRSLSRIGDEERKIASGRLYSRPSDAPLSVRRIISWERTVTRTEKLASNISLADSRLSAAETSLDELNNIIIRAREIALSQINASATEQTRANASVEISSLIDASVTLANRQFGDRYLFGGSLVDEAPFDRLGSYVVYRGDEREPLTEIAPGMTFPSGVTGVRAFAAFSSEISGREDLDPAIDLTTPLSVLNGGRGIASGTIEVRDGSGDRIFVDLSVAKTVGDVIDLINGTGFVTATLNGAANGIAFDKAGFDLSVLDVNGGKTASDLGIAKQNMGANLAGDDLDATLVSTTPIALLRGGLGLDLGGLTITNGTLNAEVDFSSADSVEDLLNAITASGTNTVARIAADGRGLELVSSLSGAELSVEEGTGLSAAQLGLAIPIEEVELTRLNGGLGISVIDGADFEITLADGSSFQVDVSSAATVGDVLALINDHPQNGGVLVADLVPGSEQIRLTDGSVGPDEMTVIPVNASFASSGLGIQGTATGGVLVGDDLNPAGVRVDSVFDGFSILYQGLVENDEKLIGRAMQTFDIAEDRVLSARAEIGGRVRRLEISERRTEVEILQLQELISEEGDTDLAEAITSFNSQEVIYQASLQTASRIMQLTILDFLG